MMGHFVNGVDYDEEELRRLRSPASDVDGAVNPNDDSDDTPEPNYACATCGEKTHISEHKRRAPAWCDSCECIKSHERLDE
jgi:hypothetical protein